MSRNAASWIVMVMLCLGSAGVVYADTPALSKEQELAYRVALGRGDDVALLLKTGANAKGANAENLPLLLVAAGRKDVEALAVTKALIEGGAEVNVKDQKGQTALYYAARNGRADVVGYLLEHGIDYYSQDQKGDIARTIASRMGHLHIVTQMDEYVKQQTLKVQKQYDDLEQQKKAQEEEAARLAAEAEQRKAEEAEAERKRLEAYQEHLKELDRLVYDMSYHACAFEYWSFVRTTDQTTDFTPKALQDLIEEHAKASQDASLDVMQRFETDQAYVQRVLTPSKQQIFNALTAMPSPTYRKEEGVGTQEDMEKRCAAIASNWQIQPPPSLGPPSSSAPPRKPLPKKAGG